MDGKKAAGKIRKKKQENRKENYWYAAKEVTSMEETGETDIGDYAQAFEREQEILRWNM